MSRKPASLPPIPPGPPDDMPDTAAQVWCEIVEANGLTTETVDRTALEAYSTLVARLRDARARVQEEGMVVKDARGRVMPHPALAVERQTAEQIRAWGNKFAPLVKPARRRGYMVDATTTSIVGAKHLEDKKFAGPVAAVKTLAWMIDEAQREGMDALQKAAEKLIPNYLKACADLEITPASVPAASGGGGEKGGSSGGVADFQARARERRTG